MSDSVPAVRGRPLVGRRVLVTRAPHQAKPLERCLAELGADVIRIPTIRISRSALSGEVSAALATLSGIHGVVFTAPNAVDAFFHLLAEVGRDDSALQKAQLCVVGPETAEALQAHGLRPDLVSGEYTAAGLADILRAWDLRHARVLIVRAHQNRDVLPYLLEKRGAHVDVLPVYSFNVPRGTPAALRRLFRGDGVDVITFSGTGTLRNFVACFSGTDLAALQTRSLVACMGPVTAACARESGMRVDIVADEYTALSLAHAVVALLRRVDDALSPR
jgi:uroporphyrinogen III methyltransferase/synthase